MDTIYKRPNDLLDLALYFLVSEVVYIQSLRPPHQRGSTKQDPADHWALWRPAKYCEKRKLKWYGHVTRSSGLAKTVLQGTVPGGRRRGRQKKRWEDNIREWTGLGLSECLRRSENREGWRELVADSAVAPLQSTWLIYGTDEMRWDMDT